MNRTITDNVNLVFDFVGENWRLWLKVMIYYLMPFSVLLGTTIATFYDDSDKSMSSMMTTISIVLFIVGCIVVTTLQLLLVKWNESHDGTLDGCDATTLWHQSPKAFFKCMGIMVLWTPLVALGIIAIVIPIVGLVVTFAVLPVFFMCPIMLLEQENSFSSITGRAFSLGFKKWGKLILIAVIMVIVALLLNNTVTFPLGLFNAMELLLADSSPDSTTWSFVSDIVHYILYVAECFMIFVEIGLFVLAMTFHYGSVAAEVEDIGLDSDIENFAQLK